MTRAIARWQWLAGWPLRRLRRARAAWRGIDRPTWWPRERAWPLGISEPHADRLVTLFVGGRRYEFVPVQHGRNRGHAYEGTLRPEADFLAERLAALGLDPAEARLLAAVSSLEGGFDSFQTYAQGRVAWGFMQFTGTGGLPALLARLKELEPERFARYFGAGGIDAQPGTLVVHVEGRALRGWRALNRLHDEPALWKHFMLAAHDPAVQDVQIRAAYEHYLLRSRDLAIEAGGSARRLGSVLAGHPLGLAVLFDQAISGGMAHTGRLYGRAARRVQWGANDAAAEAADLLARALEMDPQYQARYRALLDALRQVGALPSSPSST